MREDIDISHFKKLLEEELKKVERELATVGRKNPEYAGDWVAAPARMDILRSDKNEVADNIEELEERTTILTDLETQYNEIKAALKRIADGSYGFCKNGGEPIPEKRLEAYPAAKMCLEHSKPVP